MTNLKFLFLCLIFSTCSCSINLKSAVNKQCNFDSENLKVWSSHSNDTIFHYINLGFAFGFQYLEFETTNCIYTDYKDVDEKEIGLQTFTISNIGCKDSLWAKNMILAELKQRCPFDYYFTDTFCVQKNYTIKLVDSSLLVKSKHVHYDVRGNFGGGMDDWIENLGVEFKDISRLLVPNLIGHEASTPCDRGDGYMLDSLSGRFDIKNYFTVYEKYGEEAHIKMVRDSLGFDIKWVKDELVPYKIITYTKKKG